MLRQLFERIWVAKSGNGPRIDTALDYYPREPLHKTLQRLERDRRARSFKAPLTAPNAEQRPKVNRGVWIGLWVVAAVIAGVVPSPAPSVVTGAPSPWALSALVAIALGVVLVVVALWDLVLSFAALFGLIGFVVWAVKFWW